MEHHRCPRHPHRRFTTDYGFDHHLTSDIECMWSVRRLRRRERAALEQHNERRVDPVVQNAHSEQEMEMPDDVLSDPEDEEPAMVLTTEDIDQRVILELGQLNNGDGLSKADEDRILKLLIDRKQMSLLSLRSSADADRKRQSMLRSANLMPLQAGVVGPNALPFPFYQEFMQSKSC